MTTKYFPAAGINAAERRDNLEYRESHAPRPEEENLYRLTEYVAGDIDYSQFPDAEVVTQDGEPLNECADEPAQFQEWMDFYQINNREEEKMRFELFIPGRDLYVFEASSYEEAVDRFEQALWDAGLLNDDDVLNAADIGIAGGRSLVDVLEERGFLRYDDAFVAEVEEDSRF